jgi:rhodanese-related sulfurtransferase
VFATWLGWLFNPDRPLVIVRNSDQDPDEVVWQARKVGYDHLAGELAGGFASWAAASQPVAAIALVGPEQIEGQRVLDIRQRNEFSAGHLPGAQHLELGDVAARVEDLPPGPTVVMCGHGERAMGAASVLARSGRTDVTVLAGGPEDWAQVNGSRLESGE